MNPNDPGRMPGMAGSGDFALGFSSPYGSVVYLVRETKGGHS